MTAFRAAGVPGERAPTMLAPERLSILEASAQYHARRVAPRVTDAATDISDIRQSLLVAALARIGRFDPERAGWSTFVDIVVEHAASDYTRQRLQRRTRDEVSLDEPGVSDAIVHRADADGRASAFARTERMLDLERAVDELPEHLRRLWRLLQHGPSLVARRQSGLSQPEFYRQIEEIRMRFRAFGLFQWGTS